jgi:23S rRNA pseudouridine1911/1915/1917 synthase
MSDTNRITHHTSRITHHAAFCVLNGADRLDRFLADQLGISRTAAARLIAERRVSVGSDAQPRPSLVPALRAEIIITFAGEAAPRRLVPREIPLDIAYEDEDLAVIDKPAGLVVHPAPGHWDDTLMNALAARGLKLEGGPAERAGIIHRLDKDTSGLLVVARSARAHEKLGKDMAARRIERRYAALAWGHVGAEERRIEAPLARHPNDRKRMHVPKSGGRHAVTRVVSVARGNAADLVRCTLETGRTHQIRVHLQMAGHPIVGDPVYGGLLSRRGDRSRAAAEALVDATPRQALHAAWLRLTHPVTGKPLDVRSEWPPDLVPALASAIGDANLLAETKPLQYLGFFASDGPP